MYLLSNECLDTNRWKLNQHEKCLNWTVMTYDKMLWMKYWDELKELFGRKFILKHRKVFKHCFKENSTFVIYKIRYFLSNSDFHLHERKKIMNDNGNRGVQFHICGLSNVISTQPSTKNLSRLQLRRSWVPQVLIFKKI